MGKDMMAVLNRQLKSYKPRRRPVKPHLGFANKQEERIFRAFAAVYPKAVRITESIDIPYQDDSDLTCRKLEGYVCLDPGSSDYYTAIAIPCRSSKRDRAGTPCSRQKRGCGASHSPERRCKYACGSSF